MYTDDVGAGENRGGNRACGSPIAFGRRPIADRGSHERLARRTDEQRTVQRRRELGQPGQHTIAVRRAFGKPDPGIDDEPLDGNAGGGGDRDALGQLPSHIGDHILIHRFRVHRFWHPSRVHEDDRRAAARHDVRDRRIEAETAHIVDDRGAGVDGGACDVRLGRVDRDRDRQPTCERAEHRHDPRELFGGRNGVGAGARRFAADVDKIGAVLLHAQRRVDGGFRIEEAGSFGE